MYHRLDWFRSAWQGKAALQWGIQIFFFFFLLFFLSGFTLTGLVQYSELEGGDSIIWGRAQWRKQGRQGRGRQGRDGKPSWKGETEHREMESLWVSSLLRFLVGFFFFFNIVMTWKIMGASKVSVIYIYIYIYILCTKILFQIFLLCYKIANFEI